MGYKQKKADWDPDKGNISTNQICAENVVRDVEDPIKQLIYSQWACGRKVLPGEGLGKIAKTKKLFRDLFRSKVEKL